MNKVNDTLSLGNAVAVVIAAKDKAAYTKARNAFARSSGTFREVIARIAVEYFDGPITVAQFAKAMGEELGMGKGVTDDEKKQRATIRARIHDGLKQADRLKVNEKAAKAQRKPRQTKGAADAADKAQEAQEAIKDATRKPTQAELFTAFNGIISKANKATLERMANALAVALAEQAKAKEA